MCPHGTDILGRFDPSNPSTQMVGYTNYPAGSSLGTYHFYTILYTGNGRVWLVPREANKFILFNTDNSMTGYDHSEVARGYFGAVYDGKYIWVSPVLSNHVLRITESTGEFYKMMSWPSGFTKDTSVTFSTPIIATNEILLFPYAPKSGGSPVITLRCETTTQSDSRSVSESNTVSMTPPMAPSLTHSHTHTPTPTHTHMDVPTTVTRSHKTGTSTTSMTVEDSFTRSQTQTRVRHTQTSYVSESKHISDTLRVTETHTLELKRITRTATPRIPRASTSPPLTDSTTLTESVSISGMTATVSTDTKQCYYAEYDPSFVFFTFTFTGSVPVAVVSCSELFSNADTILGASAECRQTSIPAVVRVQPSDGFFVSPEAPNLVLSPNATMCGATALTHISIPTVALDRHPVAWISAPSDLVICVAGSDVSSVPSAGLVLDTSASVASSAHMSSNFTFSCSGDADAVDLTSWSHSVQTLLRLSTSVTNISDLVPWHNKTHAVAATAATCVVRYTLRDMYTHAASSTNLTVRFQWISSSTTAPRILLPLLARADTSPYESFVFRDAATKSLRLGVKLVGRAVASNSTCARAGVTS
eukprot:PhM_4_TR9001/c0_g1_i1/m.2371